MIKEKSGKYYWQANFLLHIQTCADSVHKDSATIY